jgi:hypothetical protein
MTQELKPRLWGLAIENEIRLMATVALEMLLA